MSVQHITVKEDDDGQRLDRWLKKVVPDLPFGLSQKLISPVVRQGFLRAMHLLGIVPHKRVFLVLTGPLR